MCTISNQDLFVSSKSRTDIRTKDSEATLKLSFGVGVVSPCVTATGSVQNKYFIAANKF